MALTKTLLYYGALLHDIGKVMYRETDSGKTHTQLGAEFITQEVAPLNEHFVGENGRSIAQQVRYHNRSELTAATNLPDDSLAYIVSFACEVSKGVDDEDGGLCHSAVPSSRSENLRKIFNTLNGHHDSGTVDHEAYGDIRKSLRDGLVQVGIGPREVGSLLSLLEDTVSTIPASTCRGGLIDVSLYDYSKVTAGIAACVYDYLTFQGVRDYRYALFGPSGADAGSIPMFLLYSCDMSGIQDFIYNISGDGALKQLRARSLYLELLLEHVVDELLERLDLSRANLLYTGGGHAYLLLPNTKEVESDLVRFGEELKAWFVSRYRNDLYVASSWVACCANDLANRGEDRRRYSALYRRLSRGLSECKAHRYDAATIRALNFAVADDYDHSRECSECHRSDLKLDKDGKCTLCSSLGAISQSLVDKDVFVVERVEGARDVGRGVLELPFGCALRMCTLEESGSRAPWARRAYMKSDAGMPARDVTRIWMGDYTADTHGEGLSAYASQSSTLEDGKGTRRLGVLRADVDDLGATFVSGLADERTSIVRTTTLSRSLSYFFKDEINRVLERGGYQAQIIYSGGDDLFIVGNWSDVLYAAIDIRQALDTYTGNGSLTLSAGVGMYGDTYPIARMASETGSLEDAAKGYVAKSTKRAKNAIALWAADTTFGWDEFVKDVEPRVRELKGMLQTSQKGNAFVYRLADLLRSDDAVASAPRLAYLLARSFEDDKEHGGEIARRLYELAQDPEERRRLVAALEWYIYSVREGSE